jgi:hypothetical protein
MAAGACPGCERAPAPVGAWLRTSSLRSFLGTTALLASLAVGLVGVAPAQEKPSGQDGTLVVRYHDDKLTVRAKDAATPDVLEQLARSTGASIHGAQPAVPRISADFDNVPLVEGLDRLLGKNSFNLVYGRDGLREIRLLGTGPAVSVKAAPAQPEDVPQPATLLAVALMLPLRNHPPIPVSGILEHALGTKAATFDQLVRAALHDGSPEVRDAAAKLCIQTVEADPSITHGVQNAVAGMDDQQLTTAAQRLGSANVEQFVRAIATSAHEEDLRSRATAVLERLRARPASGG